MIYYDVPLILGAYHRFEGGHETIAPALPMHLYIWLAKHDKHWISPKNDLESDYKSKCKRRDFLSSSVPSLSIAGHLTSYFHIFGFK